MGYMRGRDIPALRGRSREERVALCRQAYARDRWLIGLRLLNILIFVGIAHSLIEIIRHFGGRLTMWEFFAIYAAVGFPCMMLFHGWVIHPRIQGALELRPQ